MTSKKLHTFSDARIQFIGLDKIIDALTEEEKYLHALEIVRADKNRLIDMAKYIDFTKPNDTLSKIYGDDSNLELCKKFLSENPNASQLLAKEGALNIAEYADSVGEVNYSEDDIALSYYSIKYAGGGDDYHKKIVWLLQKVNVVKQYNWAVVGYSSIESGQSMEYINDLIPADYLDKMKNELFVKSMDHNNKSVFDALISEYNEDVYAVIKLILTDDDYMFAQLMDKLADDKKDFIMGELKTKTQFSKVLNIHTPIDLELLMVGYIETNNLELLTIVNNLRIAGTGGRPIADYISYAKSLTPADSFVDIIAYLEASED